MNKDTYIEDDLLTDIKEYCELNALKPVIIINGMLKRAFLEMKWLQPGLDVGPKLPIVKNVNPTTLSEELYAEYEKEEIKQEPKNKNDLYGE